VLSKSCLVNRALVNRAHDLLNRADNLVNREHDLLNRADDLAEEFLSCSRFSKSG